MSPKKNGQLNLKDIPDPVPKPIEGAPRAFATEVTPDIAVKWLEKNTMNRPLRQSSIDTWAEAMKAGKWELNGHTIIISNTGDVLDGQHRLSACFLSGATFESYVIIGMTKDVFATLDTGKKRSGADALSIHNKMNGIEGEYESAVIAACRTCLEYKEGVWKTRHTHTITNADMIQFLEANPGIVTWVKKAKTKKRDWVNRHAASIGAVAYLGSKKYPMKAETFVEGFVTGDNLAADSPIRELRRKLGTETKWIKWDRLKLIIYGWNLHINNEGRHTLKRPTEVPVIAGTEPPSRLKKESEKDAPLKKRKKIITISDRGARTVRYR